MARQYFGTDGIRGRVGTPPMTPDFALRLGHAVGQVLRRQCAQPLVLIGKDTRRSGYMLESALESGFNSAGVDVLLLGPVPTPAVAYLTRAQRADLGVVISASHNAHPDNGIKFFDGHGSKLPDAWEQAVEDQLQQPAAWAASEELGKTRRLNDAAGRYIEFCKSTWGQAHDLRGLRVVVDAAHGAAYAIAPALLQELGATVHAVGCQPDGSNINDGVGATHLQAAGQALQTHQADLAIALDGDADRLQMVSASGRVVDGDALLYALAMDRLALGQPLPGVVGTLMTNQAVADALAKHGVALHRAPVGDRYVLEALLERGWVLGGEGSGHLLMLDKHTTGDGLVSALQVLHAMQRQGKTLDELLQGLTLFPQCLKNVVLQGQAVQWQSHAPFQQVLTAAQQALHGQGRVLVRASGTEPLLRIMVEASSPETAASWAEALARALG